MSTALRHLSLATLALSALASACSSSDPTPAPAAARACALAPPALPDWRLHAAGTELRDSLERVVFLRGVDAGGRSKFAPFVPFDYAPGQYASALAAYMDRAASWGITAMRVPFTWAAWEPVQGKDDAEWLSRYDQLLDAAWARGIYTVVDFHQDVYAEVFCGDGFPAWTVPDPKPMPHHDCAAWGLEYNTDKGVAAAFDRFWADGSPVQAEYVALWDRVVARYKDRPGVIAFEPLNEPAWGTQDLDTFEATTLSAFFARMVTQLRKAAPTTLVFVEPSGLAGVTRATKLVRPPGDGVVFAPHFYPLGAHDPEQVQTKMKPWADLGTSWNAPVFIGEFGTNQSAGTTPDYMQAHFAALDALGMSGTEWEYSVSKDVWNAELFGVVAADGTELPVAQALIRPTARAVAGASVVASFDAAARAYALDWAPHPGVTEIEVSSRAYPSGFDVSLEGGCYDATHPGRVLVQADASAAHVALRLSPR